MSQVLLSTGEPKSCLDSSRDIQTELAAEAQLLPHPLVTPKRSIVTPVAAHALPPNLVRPLLAHPVMARRQDGLHQPAPAGQTGQVGGVVEGFVPKPGSAAMRGQAAAAGGQAGAAKDASSTSAPSQNARSRNAPAGASNQDRSGHTLDTQTTAASATASDFDPAVVPGGEPGAAGSSPSGLVVSGAPAQRPLFNRAVPPPRQPSFEEQQRAMESIDPGRPLSPGQMQNLRQHQPAGPPQMREQPHPAAQPAPSPRFTPPSLPKH